MFGALLRQDRERWGFAWRAVGVAQSLPVDFEFTLWDWGAFSSSAACTA
jgi:hypothetical protein